MASVPCTFSGHPGHLPRLRVAALPPHVYALLTRLARDRQVDETLRVHAERCWHDRAERRESAEAIAQITLGMLGLGRYLEGCFAQAWNEGAGWIDVPTRLMWAERYERGQTFRLQDVTASRSAFQVTLTRAQVRHVGPMRSWARSRLTHVLASDAEIRSMPRRDAAKAVRSSVVLLEQWLAAKDPTPHGRKSLFTPEWWEYADWVYRHFGKREANTDIARSLEWVTDVSPQADYISSKQRDFMADGRLVPIRAHASARVS
jgi:hypothetical protein